MCGDGTRKRERVIELLVGGHMLEALQCWGQGRELLCSQFIEEVLDLQGS